MNYIDLYFETTKGECRITVADAYLDCTDEEVKDAMNDMIASGVYLASSGFLTGRKKAELREVTVNELEV